MSFSKLTLTQTTLALSLAALPLFTQASNTGVNQLGTPETAPMVFGSAFQANPLPRALDAVSARAGTVLLVPSASSIVADAASVVTVAIEVQDFRGNLLEGKTQATVELKNGVLVESRDIDPIKPANQIELVNGRAVVKIKAPAIQQDVLLRVTVGGVHNMVTIKALPYLRDMMVAGVLEIRGHLNKLPPGGVVPARENDLFEKELTRTAEGFSNERGNVGGRAAFYLKGKVKGEYLLTAMYDSDKDTRGQQFRDIDPEKFYAVYGDSSIKGVDAQSSGKFFVRVDSNRSYILYGDFASQEASITQLGNMSRGMTGAKWHYETENTKSNVFASYDSLKQVVDEFSARGVSGPYAVSNPTGVSGSEKVEIIVRDRNQPALILRTTLMTRYDDYEFEPFNGRIVFRSPVASFDANLNPVFIRVSYAIETGGDRFLVAGVNTQVKLGDNVTLAATVAKDQNPAGEYAVGSVAAQVKTANATFDAEVAKSEGIAGGTASTQEGKAARLGAAYNGTVFNAGITAVRADSTFSNTSGGVSSGRMELNARAGVKLGERVTLVADALKSEDLATKGYREGASLGLELQATDKLRVDIGMKQSKDVAGSVAASASPTTCIGFNGYNANTGTCNNGSPFAGNGGGLAGAMPNNDVTAIHLKVSYQISPAANIYVETDVSTQASSTRMIAIGGDVAIAERTRLYGRFEDISSVSGTYGLTAGERTRQGVLGVSSDYMTDGQVFNEYRVNDSITSQRTENAIGLRNGFKLTEALKLNTNIEYLKVLSGSGGDAKSVGLGMEYIGAPLWKTTLRLEGRQDSTSNNVLSTASVARKLSNDWTVLLKNYNNKQTSRTSNEYRTQAQFQIGFALRPQNDNTFNLLAKYEYRTDNNQYASSLSRENAHILSLHSDWHPSRLWNVSNRVAYKQRLDTFGTLQDRWSAVLVGGRVSYDVNEKWTVGGMANYLASKGAAQFGVAAEVGYIVAPNAMLNLGYNVRGLNDKDLVANDYRNQGFYFGLRYKFDENAFSGNDKATNLTLDRDAK